MELVNTDLVFSESTQTVLGLIAEATTAIPSPYIKFPVAELHGGPTLKALERVYCYELYHRMRPLAEKRLPNISLSGEVDKRGHPIIRRGGIPDFLFHEPGNMGGNLAIVEVKRIDAEVGGVRKDIKRLRQYLSFKDGAYRAGVLLFFGESGEKNPTGLIRSALSADREMHQRSYLHPCIRVLWHRRAGEAAFEVPLEPATSGK